MTPALPEGCPDVSSVLDSGLRGGLDPGGPGVPGRTVTGQMGREPAGSSQNPHLMEAQKNLPPGPQQTLCTLGPLLLDL